LQKVGAGHQLWKTTLTPIFYIACWALVLYNY